MHNLTDEWFAIQAVATQPWLPRTAEDQRDQALVQARLTRLAGAEFGVDCYVAPGAQVFTQSLRLGDRSWVASGAILRGEITIAEDCSVNPYAHLAGHLSIGRECRIGSHACLFGFAHGHARTDISMRQQQGTSLGIVIGDDVMIGPGAILSDGVTVGAHSVVQAGAVLEGSFAPYSVIGGNPARRLQDRRGDAARAPAAALPAGGSRVRDLLFDSDPYEGRTANVHADDLRTTDVDTWMAELVQALRPRLIVDVGAGLGASSIHLADLCVQHGIEAEIVCVDTWLGTWRDWTRREGPGSRQTLGLMNGYPTLYWRFLDNVLAAGHASRLTPLPLPSTAAAHLLGSHGVRPDLIYLDADHAFEQVEADLSVWTRQLSPEGILLGDDHDWPEVAKAVELHVARSGTVLELRGGRYLIRTR